MGHHVCKARAFQTELFWVKFLGIKNVNKEYIQNGIHWLWSFYIIVSEISTEYLDTLYVNSTKWLNENVFCNNN